MSNRESPDARIDYWKTQIETWQASGQTQLAFCKANNVSYPSFGYWRRKFRQQATDAAVPRRASGFIPVVASPIVDALAVHLPNGMELRGITEQNLALVVQLLARL